MRRFLPHAVLATSVVIVLPALLVWSLLSSRGAYMLIMSAPLTILLSVAAAHAGSALWARRADSRDLVFADLMLWGWLRRAWTEHRIGRAQRVLGLSHSGMDWERLSSDRRVELLERLICLLEARDVYTLGHTRRVARHAERIARTMHLPPTEVLMVRTAAALHDIGKVHTPRAILNKPGRLTDEEFAVIKRHPVEGAEMIAGICDNEVTAIVRHHHERLDGRGYPDGLSGDQIPLGSRIIAVADTFDAMTSMRAYRRGCGHKRALDVIASESGTQLDATVVAAFLSYYSGRRAVASWALLTATLQRVFAWLGSSSAGFAGAAQGALALGGAVAVLAGIGGHTAPPDQTRAGVSLRVRDAPVRQVAVASARTGAAIVHPHRPALRARQRMIPSVGPITRRAHDIGQSQHPSPAAHGSTGAGAATNTTSTPTGTGEKVNVPAVTTPSVAPAPGLDRAAPSLPVQAPPIPAPELATPPVPPTGATLPPKLPTVTTPAVTTPAVTLPAVKTPAVPIPALPTVAIPAVTMPTITVPLVTIPTVRSRPSQPPPPVPIIGAGLHLR